MLHVQSLAKTYRGQTALQPATFQVARGEIVGVLGPQGAGKTTLLRMLAGSLQPDAGSIHIGDLDLVQNPHAAQARIGFLPMSAPAYPDLSVQAQLRLMAELRGIAPSAQSELLSPLVYAAQLQAHLAEPVRCLNRGQRQRLGLALALLHRPALLLLDEPLTGLDPSEAAAVRHLIERRAQHSAVLLATPSADEVEALCDRALILLHGTICADVRLADLRASTAAVLVLDAPVRAAVRQLRSLPGVQEVIAIATDCGYPAYRVRGEPGADLCPAISTLVRKQDWPLRELRADYQTLTGFLAALAGKLAVP